ncbi:MAG: NBR1-Ig-like domain-containing protein [Anaerolineaceae bacterium]|nr:NBR1-Ig-like domain-containing protein [Anaerolineaceae bacterium]
MMKTWRHGLPLLAATALTILAGCGYPLSQRPRESTPIVAQVTLPVLPSATPTRPPSPTPTPTRTPRPTATPAALPPSATPTLLALESFPAATCEQMSVLEDVTVPDGSLMEPGEIFTKVWLVKNSGDCPWNAQFDLYFQSGERMQAPGTLHPLFFPAGSYLDQEIGGWPAPLVEVGPGESAELALVLRAPDEPGEYRSYWVMTNAAGELLQANLWADIRVETPAERDKNDWSGEWLLVDPSVTTPQQTRLVLAQKDNELFGYFFNYRDELIFISGAINKAGTSVEGEYGAPFQQNSIPFRWVQLRNNNQFQGIFWIGNRSSGFWCGGRNGYQPPEPCSPASP